MADDTEVTNGPAGQPERLEVAARELISYRQGILRTFARQLVLNPELPGPAKLRVITNVLKMSDRQFAKAVGLRVEAARAVLNGSLVLVPEEYERLLNLAIDAHIGKQVANNFRPYQWYSRMDTIYFVTSLYRRLIELGLLPRAEYFDKYQAEMQALGFVKVKFCDIYLHKQTILEMLKIMREELQHLQRRGEDRCDQQQKPTEHIRF